MKEEEEELKDENNKDEDEMDDGDGSDKDIKSNFFTHDYQMPFSSVKVSGPSEILTTMTTIN